MTFKMYMKKIKCLKIIVNISRLNFTEREYSRNQIPKMSLESLLPFIGSVKQKCNKMNLFQRLMQYIMRIVLRVSYFA